MASNATVALSAPKVRITHEPFTWAVMREFFDPATASELATTFPSYGFRVAGASAKLFQVRSLVVAGTVHSSTATLPEPWRATAHLLASDEYRDRLGALVDRDLSGLRIDATLCRYPPGCSLAPHTDREVRDTTHVVYFNRVWQREWGGMLRVLRSSGVEDVIEEVSPELHTSVVMVRSDCSWHAVTPVVDGVAEERLSLLIHASHSE
jgi:SM-20-related protein